MYFNVSFTVTGNGKNFYNKNNKFHFKPLLDLIINRNNLKYFPIKYKIGDDMLEVDILEYGYSFESEKHFIKFLIKV
jgi:hypothetical protein